MSDTPQVLTRADIAELSADLDAGDVLECYLLTRAAALHGLANSTLHITKQALGLRYRPPADAAVMHAAKDPLELTLEYGPLRVGADLRHESIPRVMDDADETPYVTWENQAKVYYSRRISSEIYPTANYVASLTGAVLQNLLLTAVAYPNRQRVRYQPFAMFRNDTMIVRSNSDSDFVSYIWQHLANVGVDLKPVIPPVSWQVRLHATAIDKIQYGDPNIAPFYIKLHNCLHAMATQDYSAYEKEVTIEEGEDTKNQTSTMPSSKNRTNHQPPRDFRRKRRRRMQHEQAELPVLSNETLAPTAEGAIGSNSSSSEPLPDTDASSPVSHSEQAAQAAEAAAQAADQADQAGNQEAADAAHAAANAAQKAADVTAEQAAILLSESLLHGDAQSMAETVALCFSDPLYGLAPKNDGNETTSRTTTAYLYWDGAVYFRANLTAPYVSVVALTQDLPQPRHVTVGNSGDFVDWTIAFCILLFFGLFVLLWLQQVLGRNLRVIRPLYKYQRWFFDPLHHNYDDLDTESEHKGRGVEYTFGEDVIPLSMGGRRASVSYDEAEEEAWLNQNEQHGTDGGDMELVSTSRRGAAGLRSRTNSAGSLQDDSFRSYTSDSGLNGSSGHGLLVEDIVPVRLIRDPELVDMPDLSSRSKVAVPVGAMGGNSSAHSVTSIGSN